MPYTFPWNETVPGTADAANLLGTFITDFKKALRERMNTIVTDWTADPIALKADVGGTVIGRPVYIGPDSIEPEITGTNYVRESSLGYFETIVGGKNSVCPVRLPKGVTITKFEILHLNLTVGATLEFSLLKRSFALPSVVAPAISIVIMSPNIADAIGVSGVLSETVDDSLYWIKNNPVDVGTKYRVYGYRFTVNVPGASSVV